MIKIFHGDVSDGIVLDPFLGSGTTLRMAKQFNRKGIGIELKNERCTFHDVEFQFKLDRKEVA